MRKLMAAASAALVLHAASSLADPGRTHVFISDLHMGIGRDASGAWHPTEDFRWPHALEGFLQHVSSSGNDAVDLVLVGDVLELWQPPADIACRGPGADSGCSVAEITAIARAVIAAHERELRALSDFSRRGSNCVHVIPGNHDAALVLEPVWRLLAEALRSGEGCVRRAADGMWRSQDRRVVAEHGHQIGWDPNRYGNWPSITTAIDGRVYLQRPWGERFVQKIFNRAEREQPLIDNLAPLSAGVKYRIRDQTFAATAYDIARLLHFNLLETSVSQKVRVLGENDPGEPPQWDVDKARLLGRALLTGAIPDGDAWQSVLGHDGSGDAQLHAELDAIARDPRQVPDDSVRALCDLRAAAGVTPHCPTAARATLGALVESRVFPRERVVGAHVTSRWQELPEMRVYVYGHTHAFEKEWSVPISSRVRVRVFNDGAFQRVIDDRRFQALARDVGLEPGAALGRLPLDSLPACYTFVTVTELPSAALSHTLQAWHMPEGGVGRPVDVCDPACAAVGHGCR